jgi:plastocyanin
VLPLFKDPINLFLSEALFPIPMATGTAANPTVVSNSTAVYSSGVLLAPNQSWVASFPTAGTFLYFCVLHPDMIAQVNVLPAGTALPKNQSGYDTDTAAETAIIDTTATSLSARVRTAPLIEPLQDGSKNITIDNGYGDKSTKFSLNIFGPGFFTATVGDTITFILRDAMTGHTIAFNGSNEFYYDPFTVLANGTITTSKFFIRSFGDNTNWAGQFVSGGLLLPPGTPGGIQQWSIKISPDLAKNFQLPRNFTFLCNIHTLAPADNVPAGQRQYLGMTGTVLILPKGGQPNSAVVSFCTLGAMLVVILVLLL